MKNFTPLILFVKKGLKLAIQYILSLGVAFVLLWVLFKDKDIGKLWTELREADPFYIGLSIVFTTISHFSRTIRWQILYKPLGYHPSFGKGFLAVMSGYFMNLLIPRLGEVTRCGVLQKIDNIPVPTSFGTVIAERLIDMLMLILLFFVAFFIEFRRLSDFFIGLIQKRFESVESFSHIFYAGVATLLLLATACYLIYVRNKEKLHNNKLFAKAFEVGEKIVEGVSSIRKIREKKAFLFHTLMIWAMYFAASYIVVFALPQTAHLSVLAGFSILIMGSLGMAAPVQGGIGAFHFMVSSVLLLYGIGENDGLVFATVIHTSQYLFTLISGGICFIITFFIEKKKEQAPYETVVAG